MTNRSLQTPDIDHSAMNASNLLGIQHVNCASGSFSEEDLMIETCIADIPLVLPCDVSSSTAPLEAIQSGILAAVTSTSEMQNANCIQHSSHQPHDHLQQQQSHSHCLNNNSTINNCVYEYDIHPQQQPHHHHNQQQSLQHTICTLNCTSTDTLAYTDNFHFNLDDPHQLQLSMHSSRTLAATSCPPTQNLTQPHTIRNQDNTMSQHPNKISKSANKISSGQENEEISMSSSSALPTTTAAAATTPSLLHPNHHQPGLLTNRPYIIHLESNIGAGKSRIMYFLRHGPYSQCIDFRDEPIDKWMNFNGQNMLANYYKNRTQYAAQFQTYAFNTLLENHIRPTTRPVKIMERSIHSCIRFARLNYKLGYLDKNTLDILEHQYEIANKYMSVEPDLVVYLNVSLTECQHNIKVHQRPMEYTAIDKKYLEQIQEMHNTWMTELHAANKSICYIFQVFDLDSFEALIGTIVRGNREELQELYNNRSNNMSPEARSKYEAEARATAQAAIRKALSRFFTPSTIPKSRNI